MMITVVMITDIVVFGGTVDWQKVRVSGSSNALTTSHENVVTSSAGEPTLAKVATSMLVSPTTSGDRPAIVETDVAADMEIPLDELEVVDSMPPESDHIVARVEETH
ncbi:hypothetical protein GUJ93_ZPchr0013g37992 [Zizania palustris]|uniref:Uncharacterized protein n=1 Tax=Zizania palustris TaxID=103762 RepID=A0A8J5WRH9_ZIZPA|nr:hypothetical protein GUJ93_ZPchr0013g37992 [Zizania palustris]